MVRVNGSFDQMDSFDPLLHHAITGSRVLAIVSNEPRRLGALFGI
jgi:hypothetical protein